MTTAYRYKVGNQTIETLNVSTIPINVDYETFEFTPPEEVNYEEIYLKEQIKNECQNILDNSFRKTLDRCQRKGVIFSDDLGWVQYGELLVQGAVGYLIEIPEPPKDENGNIRYPEGS